MEESYQEIDENLEANLTSFEEDLFSDVDLKYYRNAHLEMAFQIWEACSFFLCLGLALASISAAIFLICMMVKHKRLRSRLNNYFMHYSISVIIASVSFPIYILLMMLTPWYNYSIEMMLTCFAFHVVSIYLFLTFVFATLPVVDWYITTYHSDWLKHHQSLQKYLVIVIYLIGLAKLIVLSSLCFTNFHGQFADHFFLIGYIVLVIIVLLVKFLIYKKPTERNTKTRYAADIGSILVLGWFPSLTFHYIHELFHRSYTKMFILIFIDDIPRFIGFSMPIVLVYQLGKHNKHFKMAYDVAFKRSVKTYDQPNLDEVSDEEDEDDKNTDSNNAYSNNLP